MTPSHTALLVEGDSETAEEIKDVLASLGHGCLHASTLEEARPLVAKGGFCFALVDLQIKATATSSVARVEAGETLVRELRERYRARNARDKYVLQILAMSGHSKDRGHAVKILQLGANDFIAKPFEENSKSLSDAIRECLRHSGRVEHASCAALDGVAPAAASTLPVPLAGAARVLTVTGERRDRRIEVLADGRALLLMPASFRILATLALARASRPDGWVERAEIGEDGAGANGITRLRADVGDPSIVASDGAGRVRLDPRVTVVGVEEGRLARFGDARLERMVAALKPRA